MYVEPATPSFDLNYETYIPKSCDLRVLYDLYVRAYLGMKVKHRGVSLLISLLQKKKNN